MNNIANSAEQINNSFDAMFGNPMGHIDSLLVQARALKTKRRQLESAYFDALEENNEDFTYIEDIGNGQSVSYIKDEYLHMDVASMCDYLGMADWLTQWTVDAIREEESCK